MADFSRAHRPHLLAILQRVRLFDTPAGRDLPLGALPAAPRPGLTRSDNKARDLGATVEAVGAWGPLPEGPAPLLVLLETARLYAGAESEAGQALTALYDELTGWLSPA